MAANRRTAALLLEFKIARGELEQSRRAIDQIKNLYEDLGEEVKLTDRILAAGGSRLAQVATRTRNQAIPAIDELRDSLNEAADATERLNEENERASRGGGFGGVKRLGRLAGNVPGLEGVQGGFNVADDIADAAGALSNMGTAALLASGGVLAVGAGLVALNVSLSDSKKELDAATAANQFYYSEVRRLTTEQNQARLDDIRQNLSDQRAELANIEQAFASGFQSTADQIGEGGARILFALGQVSNADDTLTARADELRASILALEGQEQALNRAREDGTTATADATAAEQAAAQAADDLTARLDAMVAAFPDQQFNNQINTLLQAQNLSSDALQDRLDDIEFERQTLIRLMVQGGLTAEQMERLRERIVLLDDTERILTDDVADLVTTREKESEAIADQKKAQEEAARLGEDIAKLETEIADIRIKSAEKLADIEQTRLDKIADAARDRDTALAEATADAEDARNEAVRDAQAEREKAEVEHQKALRRIQQEFNRDSTRAIEDRDAVALFRAQEARDEALANEKDANKERLKEIDTNLRETNRQIDRRLIEQRNTAINRYNEQLRIANEAARRAIELEQRRAQTEIQQRQAAINNLLQQQQAYQNAALSLQKNFWDASLSLARNAIGALGGTPAAGTPIPPPKPPKVKSFDTGGRVTQSGLAYVHAGEVVYNQRQQRGMGGVNFAPNVVMDYNKQKFRAQMDAYLDEFVDMVFERAG